MKNYVVRWEGRKHNHRYAYMEIVESDSKEDACRIAKERVDRECLNAKEKPYHMSYLRATVATKSEMTAKRDGIFCTQYEIV